MFAISSFAPLLLVLLGILVAASVIFLIVFQPDDAETFEQHYEFPAPKTENEVKKTQAAVRERLAVFKKDAEIGGIAADNYQGALKIAKKLGYRV